MIVETEPQYYQLPRPASPPPGPELVWVHIGWLREHPHFAEYFREPADGCPNDDLVSIDEPIEILEDGPSFTAKN